MSTEMPLPTDLVDSEVNTAERWIRAILLSGFFAVLALELWLVWQVWKLYS